MTKTIVYITKHFNVAALLIDGVKANFERIDTKVISSGYGAVRTTRKFVPTCFDDGLFYGFITVESKELNGSALEIINTLA